MPIYEHRCPACGTFERSVPVERVAERASCPGCGEPAERIYGARAGRTARRMRQLDGFDAAAVARVDRSAGAEPASGALPAGGRRIGIGGGPPSPRPSRPTRPGRPWQLGH